MPRRLLLILAALALLLAACGRPSTLDPPTYLVVVATTRHDSSGSAWTRVQAGLAAVAAHPPASGTVAILAAGCASLTTPPLVVARFSNASFLGSISDQAAKEDVASRAALTGAAKSLAKIDAGSQCRVTDLVGALAQAGNLLASAPAGWRRGILVLGSGVEQGQPPLLNMATWQEVLGPSNAPGFIQAFAAANLLPDLHGAAVCFAGVTNGAQFHLTGQQVAGIAWFWHAFVTETHGQLAAYGPGLAPCPFG